MPRASDSTYSLPPGSLVNTGDTILVSQHNPPFQDIAQALTNSLDRDGKGGMRASLNMGMNPIQNVGAGSGPNDAATVAQAASGGVPVGAVLDFAGTTAPAAFVMCFGQTLSRADYPDLFAAINVTYGAGDGSTTFAVPDARGRVAAGRDDMGGTAAGRLSGGIVGTTLGAAGGAQTHVLTVAEMPAHTHTLNGFSAFANNAQGVTGTTDVGSAQSGQTASTGDGGAHNNVQPTLVLNKIIKARSV